MTIKRESSSFPLHRRGDIRYLFFAELENSSSSSSSSAMARKSIETLVGMMMLVMALLSIRPITAHLPPGICIDHCLKECKGSGIGVAACIKYCPVHCLPPDSSTKEHYCNLGCMLDQCAKYTNDEEKMTDCVFKCRKFHCKISTEIVE